MINEDYKTHILSLAQKWRMNLLTEAELQELQAWYRSLEDKDLGLPVEMSVDKVEQRLHELLKNKNTMGKAADPDCPPCPL
ncbi:hypothetical protein [Mucilaginibacter flavus]|uniref:hypothetical protein n=1 Tax=Mucilaginibacter flavus TaxID=931504 RepID=UPI0025B4F64D|nr:hypothetical protein [Mucilaginibacter flavus]MDN3581471.1 hypothetical protein [Mucilaginibacter flavus]